MKLNAFKFLQQTYNYTKIIFSLVAFQQIYTKEEPSHFCALVFGKQVYEQHISKL